VPTIENTIRQTSMEQFVPIIETESTTTLDGIDHWANGNVTSESKSKIRLILDLYARSKDTEFASTRRAVGNRLVLEG
jgi:hypothetical protein